MNYRSFKPVDLPDYGELIKLFEMDVGDQAFNMKTNPDGSYYHWSVQLAFIAYRAAFIRARQPR